MTAEPRDDEAAPPAEKTPEKSPEEIQVGIIPGPVPADPADPRFPGAQPDLA